jgi:hypothetical protein
MKMANLVLALCALAFLGVVFAAPALAAPAATTDVTLSRGQAATITCTPGCPCSVSVLVKRPPAPVLPPPEFRFEVAVGGGVLAAGTNYRQWAATAEAGLEYRLASWLGVYGFVGVGGTGGLFEGDANSVLLAGIGAALWPADYVRIVLGGGGMTVRNPSWNFSYGGPMGLAKLDFLLGDSGFGLGATALVGPSWIWTGDMSTGYIVTAGVRWFFGGLRE